MNDLERYTEMFWLAISTNRQAKTYIEAINTYGSVHNAFLSANDERNVKLKVRAEVAVKRAIESNIGIVTVEDDEYPRLLIEYDAHPLVLFYFGDIKKINSYEYALGVVGSRNCTAEGREDTSRLIDGLKGENILIVSGMARGIDGIAHRAALRNNLFTVAVLACGCDVCYPAENRSLYEEIKKSGIIISENPPGERPVRQLFPARNRIIAGMSQSVLVTEAGIKSGALITADLALDAGRNVLSVPQPISSVFGSGCNELLKNGAMVVTSSNDIRAALGIEVSPCDYKPKMPENLSIQEKRIYECLLMSNGFSEDELFEYSGLEISEFKTALIKLMLKNAIRRLEDGTYRI